MKLLVLDLMLLALLLLLLLMLQLVAVLACCVERKIIQSKVQPSLIQAKGAVKVVGHGVLSCILQSRGSEQGGVDGLLGLGQALLRRMPANTMSTVEAPFWTGECEDSFGRVWSSFEADLY